MVHRLPVRETMAVDVATPNEVEEAPSGMLPGLPARDYHAPDVFELERERIFFRKWLCVGREEQLPRVGDYLVREILGESVLIVRDRAGRIHGFDNVCRHRGSRLCDREQGQVPGVIQCPYHGWTYSLEGNLIGTPNVGVVEGFDKADYPLHPVGVDTWEGFLFVNLSTTPAPLAEQLGAAPSAYARYRIGDLRVGHRVEAEVAANWKILAENYCECLHCPIVHPELVEIVPLFRRGLIDEADGHPGARLRPGATTWTRTGRSMAPPLPGLSEEDRNSYYGALVFPNMLIDILSDVVRVEILWPVGPERTKSVREWLFHPSAMARDDFDPSEIIEFHDLVDRQDVAVCENAQKGVRSRSFVQGVYPPQDRYVYAFDQRYRRERDGGSL